MFARPFRAGERGEGLRPCTTNPIGRVGLGYSLCSRNKGKRPSPQPSPKGRGSKSVPPLPLGEEMLLARSGRVNEVRVFRLYFSKKRTTDLGYVDSPNRLLGGIGLRPVSTSWWDRSLTCLFFFGISTLRIDRGRPSAQRDPAGDGGARSLFALSFPSLRPLCVRLFFHFVRRSKTPSASRTRHLPRRRRGRERGVAARLSWGVTASLRRSVAFLMCHGPSPRPHFVRTVPLQGERKQRRRGDKVSGTFVFLFRDARLGLRACARGSWRCVCCGRW